MKADAIEKILNLYHERCADSERASNYDAAKAELAALEAKNDARGEALRNIRHDLTCALHPDCAEKNDRIRESLDRAKSAIFPPTGKEPKECHWLNNPSLEEDDIWQTDCGHEFVLIEGAPSENEMKFCPYCGKKLVERVNDV